MREIFDELDTDGDGQLDFEEFARLAIRLNIHPKNESAYSSIGKEKELVENPETAKN